MDPSAILLGHLLSDPHFDAPEELMWFLDLAGHRKLLLHAAPDSHVVRAAVDRGSDYQRTVLAGRDDLPEDVYCALADKGPASVLYVLAVNEAVGERTIERILDSDARLAPLKVLQRDDLSFQLFQRAVLSASDRLGALSEEHVGEVASAASAMYCGRWAEWPSDPLIFLSAVPAIAAHLVEGEAAEFADRLARCLERQNPGARREFLYAAHDAILRNDHVLVACSRRGGFGAAVDASVQDAMELRAEAERVWAGNRHLTDSELLAALHGADVHLAARTIALAEQELRYDLALLLVLCRHRWVSRGMPACLHPFTTRMEDLPDPAYLVASVITGTDPVRRPDDPVAAWEACVRLLEPLTSGSLTAYTGRNAERAPADVLAALNRLGWLSGDDLLRLPFGRVAHIAGVDTAGISRAVFDRLGSCETRWRLFSHVAANPSVTLEQALAATIEALP